MTSKSPPAFFFGGKSFPIQSANRHLLFLGATGSGKSVSIRLLTQSIVPEIGLHAHEGGHRMVIYDAKQDTRGQLWEIGATCPITISNPFDERSSRWNIAQDCTSPAAAYEIANIYCPVSKNAVQPFFEQAVVNLLCGVLKALHLRAPGAWDMRTVCLVMRSEHHLGELLSQTSITRHLVRRYLQEGKLRQSVMATVDTKMEPYTILAALSHKATTTFSLRDFVNTESILVLGCNDEAREALDATNRVLMHRLTQLLLAQPDSDTRRSWIELDEVREMGALNNGCLSSLLLRGRSRSVCVIAGAQDKDGLEDIYGEAVTREMLGQFAFKAVLKLESPSTAQWASSLFSSIEVRESHRQMSRSFGGEDFHISHGVSETLRQRDVVLANQIMNMPPTSGKEGLHGVYKTPYGSFQAHIDFVPLLRRRSEAERQQLPHNYNFIARSEQDQYLDDWTAEELQRFGLTPVPPEELNPSLTPRERPRKPRGMNRGRNRNQGRQPDVNEDQDDTDEEDDF